MGKLGIKIMSPYRMIMRGARERDGIGAPYLPIMKLPYYTTPMPNSSKQTNKKS